MSLFLAILRQPYTKVLLAFFGQAYMELQGPPWLSRSACNTRAENQKSSTDTVAVISSPAKSFSNLQIVVLLPGVRRTVEETSQIKQFSHFSVLYICASIGVNLNQEPNCNYINIIAAK